MTEIVLEPIKRSPALSSSHTVTVTSSISMPLYLASLEVAVWLMTALRASWIMLLSTPVSVTVWAVFQLLVVKVKVAGLAVTIVASSELALISTAWVGGELSTTV